MAFRYLHIGRPFRHVNATINDLSGLTFDNARGRTVHCVSSLTSQYSPGGENVEAPILP